MNIQQQRGLTFTHGVLLGAIAPLVGLAVLTLIVKADWSVKVGFGKSSYSDCGQMGCWRQDPLPVRYDHNVSSYEIGAQYRINPYLSLESLYHHFDSAYTSGDFLISDSDYDTQNHYIKPYSKHADVVMDTKTEGISLSVIPRLPIGKVGVFAKLGYFHFKQSTHWNTWGYIPDYYQSGTQTTTLYGAGIDYQIKPWRLGIEYTKFGDVLLADSPVGKNGIRQMMGTVVYDF